MKECPSCHIFYKDFILTCPQCHLELKGISLRKALERRRRRSFRQFGGSQDFKILDLNAQYIIESYFKDHSLFLHFELNKNQMRYSEKFERFFIQPINLVAVFNIPWFIFNIIYSSYFYLSYRNFCQKCHCKYLSAVHSQEECDYNIAYFNILCDVLNGDITDTKKVYEQCSQGEGGERESRLAYQKLNYRHKKAEIFFDLFSILLSVMFWIYICLCVSLPMVKVLLQKLYFYKAYEWKLF